MLCDDLEECYDGEWEGRSRGWNICIYTADSFCCTAGDNTTAESNYTPLKKCSDIVLNIHISSISYYDAVDRLLQCYGLTFTSNSRAPSA